ncbi:hypothetical protein EDC01DRAFT_633841 [Geopyxis carbonaria]|nr:hypothetical protein EDC01DRAFT_633841 [Geopyxis carbonaria]
MARVLGRYDSAELDHKKAMKLAKAEADKEAHKALTAPQYDNAGQVDAFYGRSSSNSNPRYVDNPRYNNNSRYNDNSRYDEGIVTRLPECPPDWRGPGCWRHPNDNHRAIDCNTLRSLQSRFLEYKGIPVEKAFTRRGYPHPVSRPASVQVKPYENKNVNSFARQPPPMPGQRSNATQSGLPSQSGQSTPAKRKMCIFCDGDYSHDTNDCAKRHDVVRTWKKAKTVDVNMAEKVPSARPGGINDVSEDDEDPSVPAL